jgi:hypothetical protein
LNELLGANLFVKIHSTKRTKIDRVKEQRPAQAEIARVPANIAAAARATYPVLVEE